MTENNKIQKMIKWIICCMCLILTGCSAASMAQESGFESAYENGANEEQVDIYTSAASVIIQSVDEAAHVINMYLVDRNESKALSFDGTTRIQDKYGSAMTAVQLCSGDIADITYNSELERLGSVMLSDEAWRYEDVEKYNLSAGNGNATIGEESYSIGSNVLVFSDGKPIEISEIIRQDVLSFQGKGHSIMSISVDKGHGYLNLKNEDAVLGGWIEVGQTVISQIAPDMLLTVPEGSYTVRLIAQGVDETREITIERNKETVLDLGDIEVRMPEKGIVVFQISPSNAQVYVDDVQIETVYPVRLAMGLHRITVKAGGYEPLSKYFQVEGEKTTVKISMEEEATVSGNSISPTEEAKENNGTITVAAPLNVEVYQDNLYMGIAPVTYGKTAGEHTITLRKTGYITRSYTINVEDDKQDVTYAFPDLEAEGGTSTEGMVNGNTVSGNTVSGNTVSGNTVSGNTVSGNNAP
ncbi:MAG: PEGA domain-containing protein [Firmicutes bacterium]|nr:PEGA domain-containing protein [Bacillota bacterium]